jgi:uroporphyrinogen decarboxylase
MWLMRQAGRYLPEYRELRAEKGGFLELVYDSEAAAEITIQPLRRFGFDGAILFSDILIVPHAMGQGLEFLAGEGPKLSPPLLEASLSDFAPKPERFEAVYETVRLCRAQLDDNVTMLGFAGSPWTVATYMVAGEGSRDQHATRELAYTDPARFQRIIDAIVKNSIIYLRGQIDAGAEAVQLFDSWAGSLAPDQFERWVIEPNAAITAAIKQSHPDTPVIGFPKGAGAKLVDYAERTGVDALGLDETIDPVWANRVLPQGMPVQGNLDPLMLMAGGEPLTDRVAFILAAFADRPHVFNLGHGIGQFTPIEHVEQLVAAVRGK